MSARRTRVVIATRLFAPEVAAAAFRLKALAMGLAAAGATVHVVTTSPPTAAGRPTPLDGVRVSRAPVLRDAGGNVRGYIQYLSFDLPLFFRLLFVRADLVVSEPPPTTGLVVAVTSWLRRRPFVYYAADVWSDGLVALGAATPLIRVMRRVEGSVLRHAAAVIAVSDEVADKVTSFGVPASRVRVVGNGVDTSIFRIDGALEPTDGPTFVYTGSMSEWQGPSVFVEAAAMVRATVPDIRLVFVGQGVEEPKVRAAAARLGFDRVVFGGVVPPESAARWLRSATAALASITPGVGYDFAKPTKTYAAAACGTPVIFAGVGAGAQLVADNDLGWRCDHTAASVAAAMLRAIDDQRDGVTAAAAQRRSDWVSASASIQSAGAAAAGITLAAAASAAGASRPHE